MIGLLAVFLRELLGHPDRLDDLLELALDRPVLVLDELLVEEPGADQLLGDGRGAATVTAQRVQTGRDDPHRVETGVLPEGLVLDGGRGVDDDRRDVIEVDDLPLEVPESRELGLPGAVIDDRLLGQDVLGQLRGLIQTRCQRGVGPDGGEGADDADAGKEQEDDDGDRREGRTALPTSRLRAGHRPSLRAGCRGQGGMVSGGGRGAWLRFGCAAQHRPNCPFMGFRGR